MGSEMKLADDLDAVLKLYTYLPQYRPTTLYHTIIAITDAFFDGLITVDEDRELKAFARTLDWTPVEALPLY